MPENVFKEVTKTDLPDFSNEDLFYYLIHQHSHYSNEEFKSCKSFNIHGLKVQGVEKPGWEYFLGHVKSLQLNITTKWRTVT